MVDPHDALVSYQQAFTEGMISPAPGSLHRDLVVLMDDATGMRRITYALVEAGVVKATVFYFVMEPLHGVPCFHAGYAVAVPFRGQGLATSILAKSLEEMQHGFKRHMNKFYIGANRENGKNRALRRFGRAYRPQTIPRSRLANALTLYCIVDIYDRGRSLLGKIKDVERAADGSSRGRQRRSDNLSARRLSPQRVQTHPHRAGEWAVHRPRLRVLQAPIRLL